MKTNIDYLRTQMSHALNDLGDELLHHLSHLTEDDQVNLINAFNNLTIYVGSMNCIYDDQDELFNDISEAIQVIFMTGNQEGN